MSQSYIDIPADTWVQLAPPGGYELVIQPIGNVALIFGSGLSAPPADVKYGMVFGNGSPQNIADDSDGLWVRSSIPGVSSGINVTS